MITFDTSISGLQAAQARNLRRIAGFQPSGKLGQIVKDATLAMLRYVIQITHVWIYKGGGLRASHRADLSGLHGMIYIDPGAVNPRGQMPAIYGPYEHARGGAHAFYSRGVTEYGPEVASLILETAKEIAFGA